MWKKFGLTRKARSREARILIDKDGKAVGRIHPDTTYKILTMQFYFPVSNASFWDYGTCVHTRQQQARRDVKKDEEGDCWAVSKKENTLVLGEGAALLVLSNLRGKNCDFRISGVGQGFERGAHAADLRGENIVQSMKQALLNANAPRVDAVIAHAPGTRLGDENELRAIHTVLGDLPVLSNKWMLGHTLA